MDYFLSCATLAFALGLAIAACGGGDGTGATSAVLCAHCLRRDVRAGIDSDRHVPKRKCGEPNPFCAGDTTEARDVSHSSIPQEL